MAHEILGHSVRNADYWGCVRHAQVANVLNTANANYDPEFHDFEQASGSAVEVRVAGTGDTAVAGTHIIRLKGSDQLGITLDGEMNNSSAVLDVTTNAGLNVNDILLLSDCSDGVVFQATDLPSNDKIQHNTGNPAVGPGNAKGVCPPGTPSAANCFPKAYATGEIFRVHTHQFEVRQGANGRRGLFRLDGINTLELIDGVFDMRVQLGEGAPGDGSVTRWVDADNALTAVPPVNMDNVIALRISLLVEGPEDNVASTNQQLCFPVWADCAVGPNWTAADLRLYRSYSSVYSVRNRLLQQP